MRISPVCGDTRVMAPRIMCRCPAIRAKALSRAWATSPAAFMTRASSSSRRSWLSQCAATDSGDNAASAANGKEEDSALGMAEKYLRPHGLAMPPQGTSVSRHRTRLPHGLPIPVDQAAMDVRRLTRYRLYFTSASHPSPSSSRPRTTAFHAVDRGSNPLGDAK